MLYAAAPGVIQGLGSNRSLTLGLRAPQRWTVLDAGELVAEGGDEVGDGDADLGL